MSPPSRIRPDEFAALPLPPGRLSHLALIDHGLEIRHYAPRDTDPQTPHDRDEVYFVISGTGIYVRREERLPFAPGDMLYAAAGEPHRFDSFTDDFATWVVFYGPMRAGG